jgi:hypothetical protein
MMLPTLIWAEPPLPRCYGTEVEQLPGTFLTDQSLRGLWDSHIRRWRQQCQAESDR